MSLLLVSPQGDLTVIDGELNVRYTRPATAPDAILVKSFAFVRESCDFIPGHSSTHPALVLFLRSGKSVRLSVYDVGVDGADKVLEETLPLEELVSPYYPILVIFSS